MQMCPGDRNQKVQNLGLQKCRKTSILPTEHSRRKHTVEMPPALTSSLTRYLNSLQTRNMSQHTITAYRTDVSQFFTWLTENDSRCSHKIWWRIRPAPCEGI